MFNTIRQTKLHSLKNALLAVASVAFVVGNVAAALSVTVASTPVSAATPIEIPKIAPVWPRPFATPIEIPKIAPVWPRPIPPNVVNSCNVEYAACLRNGTRMSLADGASNWARCNQALAACLNNTR